MRIRSVRPVEELRDATTDRGATGGSKSPPRCARRSGGRLPPGIVIHVTQEQPPHPPRSGDFIVGVDDAGPYFVLPDDAAVRVAATPGLVRVARGNR